ncbi:ATP-grasp domain-containing protein [Acetobacter malorum]|uniref:ATP-grasp domain-containing protein n=1 Tax=Acetobacter malorum TaxID=178901 RepID=UPI000777667A|nr:ATP-grasp domain-containing protein [Acetobacter malorum]KXV05750.1 hypothetical protein AD930_11540 [Acetobacter malorum]
MDFAVLWQDCVAKAPETDFLTLCLDEVPLESAAFQDFLPILRRMRLIFHVSLQMRRKLENLGLHPEISDSPYHFDFSFLMQAMASVGLPHKLLNQNAIILPAGCITSHPYVPERLFIRPNSGMKSFPGQVINKAEFAVFQNTYRVDNAENCVIAPTAPLHSETRCFAMPGARNPLLGLSPYQHEDTPDPSAQPITDSEASEAIKAISSYQFWPDAIVVDLCRSEGSVRIVEVNSVSTSGTYLCGGITKEIARNL